MTREVYHCLEPSCQLRFVRQSAYDKHIEKHINNGLYLPDVTAAGLRKAQGPPPPLTYTATLTTAKKTPNRSARSPSHVTLSDKKRARQSSHAAQAAKSAKLVNISNQEARRLQRQSLLTYKRQAMTTRQVTTKKHRRGYRNKDGPANEAGQGEKRRRRCFKSIASGSIGIPHSIKGKTAVVDLRSPSRSTSPSIVMDLPDFDHGAGDGIGSSRATVRKSATIDERASHLFTPEPTPPPIPISHAHLNDAILPSTVNTKPPHTPLANSSTHQFDPITPDSSNAKVIPTWSISPDSSVTSGPVDMQEDGGDGEPIGQLFARMLKERDELEDEEGIGNGNEADDEGMDSEGDAESSVVSSDSDIDDDGNVNIDIDPPQISIPIPIHAPTLVNQTRHPSPLHTHVNVNVAEDDNEPVEVPPPPPDIDIIEILDTDSESETEVDEWDLFDVENQIFGYRVPAGHTTTSPTKGLPQPEVSVPKSPFKGLSPRRPRPEEFDGPGI